MFRKQERESSPDSLHLNGDLQATYVELLSAQCAVDKLRLRYSPELVAKNGGSFMLLRSISAAVSMFEYFRQVEQYLPEAKTKRV